MDKRRELSLNKFDNPDEMDKFLETHNLLKLDLKKRKCKQNINK